MIYLDYFTFPDSDMEFDFFMSVVRTCYDSYYPFQILSKHGLERIDVEPVTILYGGNGSGNSWSWWHLLRIQQGFLDASLSYPLTRRFSFP